MTSFFEHQRSSFKRNYLRNLIVLASADGHLDESEKKMIFEIGKKRGLKEWQIGELLNDNSHFEIFIPDSFMNRMNVLYDLMQIIYADGFVDTNEVAFVKNTLKAFNLSPDLAMELIEMFEESAPSMEDWRDFTETLQPVNNLQQIANSLVSQGETIL
jgi:uncharacterized membrane protein YebE (DUF533 family)